MGLALFWEIHLNIYLEKSQSNSWRIVTKYQTVNPTKKIAAEEIKTMAVQGLIACHYQYLFIYGDILSI